MTQDEWIWMPHPAHFICSDRCQFHLSTYVGKYIVSTVGEYWPDERVLRINAEVHDDVYKTDWYLKNKGKIGDEFRAVYFKQYGWEEIGANRTYETMVFRAVKAKDKHTCCPWRINVSEEVDFYGYKSANDAYKGHLKLCKKWSNL